MKIVVVSQCFYPDIYAISDIVKVMAEMGHEITVLTGLPDYTTSKIPKEYKWFRNRHQKYNGAEVFRVPTIARHHGAFFRSLNYISFAISGWLFAKLYCWKEFDAIYVWGVSPITMAIPAIALKRRYKKPLFLYCLDLWPESVKAMGFKEDETLFKTIHFISKWIYEQCDHVAVSSKPFFDYLEKVNDYPMSKMSYLPQYASEEFLNTDLSKKENGLVDFLFIGNIGKVQNVECIIRSCSLLNTQNNVTVHIVGDGSNLNACKQLSIELNVTNIVKFYGAIQPSETLRFYKNADACLLTLKGDSMIGNTLPGKLQTYMAAGKPIIAAIDGAGKQIVEESGCGLVGPADDADALAKNMLQFLNSPEKFQVCGENGREYFRENFSKKQHFETLETCFRNLQGYCQTSLTEKE